MNERIEKLAEQAKQSALTEMIKIHDKDNALKVYSDTYDTKFAELIVQDCEKSIKSVPTHFEAQDKIIVECLKTIRETFRS